MSSAGSPQVWKPLRTDIYQAWGNLKGFCLCVDYDKHGKKTAFNCTYKYTFLRKFVWNVLYRPDVCIRFSWMTDQAEVWNYLSCQTMIFRKIGLETVSLCFLTRRCYMSRDACVYVCWLYRKARWGALSSSPRIWRSYLCTFLAVITDSFNLLGPGFLCWSMCTLMWNIAYIWIAWQRWQPCAVGLGDFRLIQMLFVSPSTEIFSSWPSSLLLPLAFSSHY